MNDSVRLDNLGTRDAPPRRGALVCGGLVTVGDLRRAHADGSLFGLPGVGPVGRRRIGKWLARNSTPAAAPPPPSQAARAVDDAAEGAKHGPSK